MSVSFVKAAFADKPTLMRRWFFARVFNASAQAQTDTDARSVSPRKVNKRAIGRRKLSKAA